MADRLLSALTAGGITRRLVSRVIDGGRRLVRGLCEECCTGTPGVIPLYALACPCAAYRTTGYEPTVPEDCQVPEGECIYVDLRSVLSDDLLTTLGERIFDFWTSVETSPGSGVYQLAYTGPVIIVGGVCYRFSYPWEIYADAATTLEEREAAVIALLPETGFPGGGAAVSELPGGVTLAGGDGTTITVVADCTEAAGCDKWLMSVVFYEVFDCSGDALSERTFLCAAVAFGGSVLDTCLCVDRSVGYSAADVDAIEAVGGPGSVTRIYDPSWLLAWTKGTGGFSHAPAPSCCFCAPTCLTGRKWSKFGSDSHWWYEEVCCGKSDTLAYHVVLSYTRVIQQTLGPGDVLTTTVTVEIDDTFTSPSATNILVTGTVTTRGQRPATGYDVTSDSPLEIYVGGQCCLYPDVEEHAIPTVGTWTFPGPTFTDSWDGTAYTWGERTEGTDPLGVMNDLGYNLREAWNITPWATAMAVVSVTSVTDTYLGTGSCFGSCSSASFLLEESVDDGAGRTESVSINLHVTKIEDDSAPCNWAGGCGSGGWGLSASLLDLLA